MTVTTITGTEAWVTSAEVAEHLGCSSRTLSDYRRRGLPHVQISPRVFKYRLTEVDRWVASVAEMQQKAG